MIARAFKPVAWVAAVAVPALGCYMLSLKVAAERAELANVEARILAARQDIRTLQTELGTRGRLQQLEQWNADVLALAAPVSTQFLARDVSLARFDTRGQEFAPAAQVQVAAAEAPRAASPVALAPQQASLERPQPVAPAVVPEVRRAALTEDRTPTAPRRATPAAPTVRQASATTVEQRPVRQPASTPQRRTSLAAADERVTRQAPPQRRAAATAPRTERSRPLVSNDTQRSPARRARSERK